jgi:hypothetical protein
MLVSQRVFCRMKHQNRIIVKSSTPPTVEFDSSTLAWYVRFSKRQVAKTLSEDKPGAVVGIDLDSRGEVVGVELLGVRQFEINMIQRMARVDAPNIDMTRARFIPTNQAAREHATA